jgi:hypothetical protein
VVTSALSARLADRLAHRAAAHHGATLVYVDPASFTSSPSRRPPSETAAQLLRLQRAGIPVAIVRRGDDLAAVLGPDPLRTAVG